MNTGYQITRDKFFASNDIRKILRKCEEKGTIDLRKGRKTWVTRHLLVHLALHSGLRVSELAALKLQVLFLNDKTNTYLIVQHGKGKGMKGKKRDVYLEKSSST